MKRILFTGGGSAGHVVPNLAVMRELRYSHELLYMGTGGIEQTLVGNAGYPFFRVDCPKLIRSFTAENLKIPFRLRAAERQALGILEKRKPDLVFSKGGFASYPAVWAAHKLNIPVLTHESDLSPGLCTKLIARRCAAVLTSFPDTAEKFRNGVYTGSPVRRELLCGEKQRARKKFGLPEKGSVLLVFGGGSGSRAINRAVEEALPALLEHFSVLHICGKSAQESRDLPSSSSGNAYLRKDYESDMGSAYACADVVLARAGSNTVFEILALKKRAVLVPLSHSSRGDQIENARYFEKRGLVKILPEERLGELVQAVCEAETDPVLGKNLESAALKSGTDCIVQYIKKTLSAET